MPRIIGVTGLVIIVIAITLYIGEMYNYDSLFMGETYFTIAYVTENNIVPKGKGVTHRIDYRYEIDGVEYYDSYYSNKSMSRLLIDDSLKLEVSIRWPSKNKVVSFFIYKE